MDTAIDIIVVIVLVLLILGCIGGLVYYTLVTDDPVTSGEVIAKDYHAPYTTVVLVHMGTMLTPITNHHPAYYSLTIQGENGKKRSVTVSEEEYNKYEIGDIWPKE